MVKGSPIGPALFYKIQALKQLDFSIREIQKKLKKQKIQISITKISRIPKDGGFSLKPRGHRQITLTIRDTRRIFYHISKHPGATLKEIKRDTVPHASTCTISRNIRNNPNLTRRRPRKDPGLTKSHKLKRVAWARKMLHERKPKWNQTIFIDETHFCCDGYSQPSKIVASSRHPFPSARKRTHGGGKIFCWMLMGPNNHLVCRQNLKTLKGNDYAKHIDNYVVGYGTIIQHDNHRIHNSRVVKDVMEINGIENLLQPPLSPDLQPIENLFHIIKQKLYKNNKTYDTTEILLKNIEKVITNMIISGEYKRLYKKLTDSMPHRLQKVIDAHGKMIRY
jgi:transposase